LNESQVGSALSALVPALAAGLQQNISSPQGLDGLVSALGSGQHQRYVDDPRGARSARHDGRRERHSWTHLRQDVSRQVASRAAAQTGISESVLKTMLPVVAAMAMGAMSKRMAASPAPSTEAQSGGAVLLGMLTTLVDSGRDGSIVNDVVGMLGRMAGR
jgi:hypothetical protein